MKKVIYDLGSNNGDDIPYYLKKAELVIAVEANPVLCDVIKKRFASAIASKRLIVENVVLTAGKESGDVFFFLHKTKHVKSQFPEPSNLNDFNRILLPSMAVVDLVSQYGDPYYVKIDIEHYDHCILRALFENDIKPPYISAESHNIEVFLLLISMGRYNSFKLVEGSSVSRHYKRHRIVTLSGTEIYSFPHHSAGPFGEDVNGHWMSKDVFFRVLGLSGMGWRDIHATNVCEPRPDGAFRTRDLIVSAIKAMAFARIKVAFRKWLRQ